MSKKKTTEAMENKFTLAEDLARYASDSVTDSSYPPSPFEPFNMGYSFNLQNEITTQPQPQSQETQQRGTRRRGKPTRTRPCAWCRRRKTKCVVPPNEKTCLECSKRNNQCIFETNDEPHVFPPPVKESSSMCDNCNHRRTTCIVPNGSSVCTECLLRDLPCKFSEMVNVNAKIRRNTPIRDYDEYQGHTILKKTLSLQGPKSSKLLGASSIIERNLLNFHGDGLSPNPANSPSTVFNNEQIQIDIGSKLRKVSDETVFKIVNDNEEFIKLSYSQVDEIEQIVFPHGLSLLNLYFSRVHPLLPVISRPVFLEKYARTHREFDPLLLSLVYLHGINLWHLDPELQDLEGPNYEKLERLVMIMYSENLVNLPPKFSTCQGLILLMHYNFRSSSSALFNKDDYWKKVSQLVTICEDLGLNHNSDDWLTIPNWERRTRKILAWALIMMDKSYALLESRPSRISSDNWVLNELQSLDFQVEDAEEVFIEKTDGENFVVNHGRLIKSDPHYDELSLFGNLIFAKMVHLSYHVNDALSAIYNLKSLKFDDFTTVCSKSRVLLNNLSNWYDSIPFHIRDVQIISNQISAAPFILSYYQLQFLIHRRIINTFIDNYDILTDEEFTLLRPLFKQSFQLISQFNQQFLSKISNEHFTNCFWYSNTMTAFINVAILYRLLTRVLKEELYLDDEMTLEGLEKQSLNYINSLRDFEPVSQSISLALNHIHRFVYTD